MFFRCRMGVTQMTYQRSFGLLWLGLLAGFIAGFLSICLGAVIVVLAIAQACVFYRCPHCRHLLLNVRGLPDRCPGCGEDLFNMEPKK